MADSPAPNAPAAGVAAVPAEKIPPRAFVKWVEFSDGTKIQVGENAIVVLVGPNNCGKSTALKAIEGMVGFDDREGYGVLTADFHLADESEVVDYVLGLDPEHPTAPGHRLSRDGKPYHAPSRDLLVGPVFRSLWPHFRGYFVNRSPCRDRGRVIEPTANYDPLVAGPTLPLQRIMQNKSAEESISALISKAFGKEFYLYRSGTTIRPYSGTKPTLSPEETEASVTFINRFKESGKPLGEEGDGQVHFAALLVTLFSNRAPILLIDEPEVFLHPPQARFIGTTLASELPNSTQLFIATHSSDVVRGLLESGSDRVHVIRLTREGEVNRAKELSTENLKKAWANPLVRHTEVLDALFHDRVVFCEGDGDCEFYRAMSEALKAKSDGKTRHPDVLFVPTMGNADLNSYTSIVAPCGVPFSVAPDFDTLKQCDTMVKTVVAAGGDEKTFRTLIAPVTYYINSLRPAPDDPVAIRTEVQRLSLMIKEVPVDKGLRSAIADAMEPSSAWDEAKWIGAAIFNQLLPLDDGSAAAKSTAARSAWKTLEAELRKLGIELNPYGQLESFDRKTHEKSGKGRKWAVAVLLARDLANDPELKNAREYVSRLIGAKLSERTLVAADVREQPALERSKDFV